jgi:hypothetical protein
LKSVIEKRKNDKVPRARSSVTTEKASKRKKKTFVSAKTRAPASSSPEIPVLSILSEQPTFGMPTHTVLYKVETEWFRELTELDTKAVYPESKKKIVDSIVKFAKKHLIMKGQVFPPSEDHPVGVWWATPLGMERALKESSAWAPKYVEVHSMIETEEMVS